MKPVLIVVDMSNYLFGKGYHNNILSKNRKRLVSSINEAVSFFRNNGFPVIWVLERLKKDLSDAPIVMKKTNHYYCLEGTDGWKLLDDLDYKKEDIMIIKKRYSAFFKTNLEKLLSRIKADTLVIAGVNTHACIRMTSIDAYERDYNVILLKDGIDSWDKEHARITLKYMIGGIAEMKSTNEIKRMISKLN